MNKQESKTLYVSDLDGTLLRSDEKTSVYTNEVINRLVDNGLLFSYATARSYGTAHKVAGGIKAKIPLICYNGAMIIDNIDGTRLYANTFGEEIRELINDLIKCGVYPLVYSLMNGKEKFSYISERKTKGMQAFLASRPNDRRDNPVKEAVELCMGDVFYLTCIDEKERLEPLYEKYKGVFHCVFSLDMYTNEYFFELMPQKTSKANAISWLKKSLGCDKVVAFGDEVNDLDMFYMADEAYAVENAADVLKAAATGIIKANDEDGVAKWLEERFK